MIRKSNIYSWLSMLAMLPIVLTACLEEDNYEQRPNQTDKIQLTISGAPDKPCGGLCRC